MVRVTSAKYSNFGSQILPLFLIQQTCDNWMSCAKLRDAFYNNLYHVQHQVSSNNKKSVLSLGP